MRSAVAHNDYTIHPDFGSTRVVTDEYRLPVPCDTSEWDTILREQLYQLTHLQHGWDGYGSPPVKMEVATIANAVLRNLALAIKSSYTINIILPQAPYLCPVSGGGLQAEWHFNKQYYLELYFDTGCENLVANFYSEGLADEMSESINLDISSLQFNAGPVVSWFIKIQELIHANREAA